MSIKVKVNLPFDVHRALENDMKSFEFVKEDGNINKNKFINHLLKNYYKTFSFQEEGLVKKINATIKSDNNDTAYQILSLIKKEEYEEKYYNDYNLQFIINKENEKIFSLIEDRYLMNRSISQYFREMFISYASHKQDKRELILFKEKAQAIEEAIKNNKQLLICYGDDSYNTFEPFAIDQTKEELYNYLIGVQHKPNKRFLNTMKLYKIKEVIILEEDSNITQEEEKQLTRMMKHGAQFPIYDDTIIKLELTPNGEKLYEKLYLNRPNYMNKENNIFYFDCSQAQIEFYFFKFGEDVKIISPENLKNRFSRKYYNALQRYQKKKMYQK